MTLLNVQSQKGHFVTVQTIYLSFFEHLFRTADSHLDYSKDILSQVYKFQNNQH